MKKNRTDELEKKLYTKKELRAKHASQRSQFSSGINLGSKVMTSPKDYDRKRAKRETRRLLENY